VRRLLWLAGGILAGLLCAAAAFGQTASKPNALNRAACGGETACTVEGGEYFIHMPKRMRPSQPGGAVFFLHGHRGKAVGQIRNKSFQTMADELGVAFIAVQGLEGTWSFPTAPRHLRDEFSFFDRVLEDVSQRFGVARDRTLLSGFSSGAFMTWYLACDDADRFSGYAPIAGAFWRPLPENCTAGTPYLFHVHGTADKVVPLAGRALGDGRWHQGDVFKSRDVWLHQAGVPEGSARHYTAGNLRCERWAPNGGVLELCLHDGGHSVRAEWIKRAWKELAKARGWPEYVTDTAVAHCQNHDDKLTAAERQKAC